VRPERLTGSDTVLGALTGEECRAVLAEVVRRMPAAREIADLAAADLLAGVDQEVIADQVADELRSMPHTDLAERSGRHLGGGYVEPVEAAWDLLGEAVEPWIADVERRARLGMRVTAAEMAAAVIEGLVRCEPIPDSTVLAWAPDAPSELAREVHRRAAAAGVLVDHAVLSSTASSWIGGAR